MLGAMLDETRVLRLVSKWGGWLAEKKVWLMA